MPQHPKHVHPLLTRRRALMWAAASPLLLTRVAMAGVGVASGNASSEVSSKISPGLASDGTIQTEFAKLEQSHHRRLGVYAIDTGSGKELGYRAEERFAFCSTFKAVLAAAILARDASHPGLLERRVTYTQKDMVTYSPVTEKHIGSGMTVSELCAAAIQYSDNTAANLLLHQLGGPSALTAYMRSIGNPSFRLDRYETELNTAIPGDPRDTSTPADMCRTLRDVVLGTTLPAAAREHLKTWLLGSKTGDRRIRAGTPAGWLVGDKTGTGDYAAANDIAVIWPPERAPIVLAIYTNSLATHAKADDALIAEAARIAIARLK